LFPAQGGQKNRPSPGGQVKSLKGGGVKFNLIKGMGAGGGGGGGPRLSYFSKTTRRYVEKGRDGTGSIVE